MSGLNIGRQRSPIFRHRLASIKLKLEVQIRKRILMRTSEGNVMDSLLTAILVNLLKNSTLQYYGSPKQAPKFE